MPTTNIYNGTNVNETDISSDTTWWGNEQLRPPRLMLQDPSHNAVNITFGPCGALTGTNR